MKRIPDSKGRISCSKCGHRKPKSAFYRRDGRWIAACKKCTIKGVKPTAPFVRSARDTKRCRVCGGLKDVGEFSGRRRVCDDCRAENEKKRRRNASAYEREKERLRSEKRRTHPSMKEYQKSYHYSWRLMGYGLTPEAFDELLRNQSYRCLICGDETRLVVDHNHTTGKVRGLLCDPCNRGIGLFRERVESLESAIRYLTKHGADPKMMKRARTKS